MEKLSQEISKSYESSENIDRLDELKLEYFKNSVSNSNNLPQEAINFTNLEFSKLLTLFDNNEKLLKDYFRFGLYNILSGKNLESFFKRYSAPFANMNNIIQFILETENKVFVLKNYRNFTEQNILAILKKILDSDNQKNIENEDYTSENEDEFKKYKNYSTYLISILINVNVDKAFLLSSMKKNKDLQFSAKQIINLFYILGTILKKNTSLTDKVSNLSNYFSIISELLLMLYIQKKIKEESYKIFSEDLEQILNEIKKLKSSNQSKLEIIKNWKGNSALLKDDFLIENIKI